MSSILHLARAHQPLVESLSRDLEEVSRIFDRQLASEFSAVNRLCLHIERYRGKMLRPTLCLLGGLATSPDGVLSDRHRTLAAVVEMIHMATLVHDDVLDEAEVRRRAATVNHLWGNETAVMLGDYLISNAFHLCSSIGDPSINLALGAVTNTVCEGELMQLRHRDDYGLDRSTYSQIIGRKTGALISASCRLGAVLSGATLADCEALDRYGAAVGLAFQIQDDLLDLIGDERVVGKSLGRDLEKGTLTLPVIEYLATSSHVRRAEALDLIKRRDAAGLRQCLVESLAIDASRAVAAEHVEDARDALALLPPTPARDLLRTLADAVIDRKY